VIGGGILKFDIASTANIDGKTFNYSYIYRKINGNSCCSKENPSGP
jgi:hypothetical protein